MGERRRLQPYRCYQTGIVALAGDQSFMHVEIAAESGFCFGVRRALSLIARARRSSEKPFYSIGPLIHNPQAVATLRRRHNVTPVENLAALTEAAEAYGLGDDDRGLPVWTA